MIPESALCPFYSSLVLAFPLDLLIFIFSLLSHFILPCPLHTLSLFLSPSLSLSLIPDYVRILYAYIPITRRCFNQAGASSQRQGTAGEKKAD
ncbi:hypothetical protein ACN38_g860 [Penicillium nordicum]|uniref:Uncharacterized protein n=1 Tax=Penicillium nordicum TaxID=229535 RepID=A0A0M8PGH9_9EURO|nr:hypothetical protein ACN38_g860 [Penicillium nordicum]